MTPPLARYASLSHARAWCSEFQHRSSRNCEAPVNDRFWLILLKNSASPGVSNYS